LKHEISILSLRSRWPPGLRERRGAALRRSKDDGAHLFGAYALLDPGLALVVEDGLGVAGFVVGTVDTSSWERKLDRDWWPSLRRQYVDPTDTPEASRTPDQRRAFMIHHPTRTPPAVSQKYPAHLT